MEDLKSVTVSYLRELARKHLGSGYSRMKKEELLAALAAHVPALAKLARLAGIPVPRKRSAAKPAAPAARPAASKKARAVRPEPVKESKVAKPAASNPKAGAAPGKGQVSAPKRVAAKRASEKSGSKPTTRPAQVVTFPPKSRVERAREPVTPVVSSFSKHVTPPVAPEPEPGPPPSPVSRSAPVQHAAETVVEGFFVARVAGEAEARSHHLVETVAAPPAPPVDDEGLGELPEGYHDDAMLLLPRDPHTLFVSWDFSLGARLRAQAGLESPRPVLRVFDGEQVERELAFGVDARGFYIHGLGPGRTYRVEAHYVGRDGRSRRIGASSNRATLPPSGVSTDHTVRFLRVPPAEAAPPVAAEEASPEEGREYVTWRRVELPGSGGVLDVPEVHRERAAKAKAEAHLEGPARAPGASDQRYVEASARAPGASDQRYVETVGRAAGASEQRYVAEAARGEHGAGTAFVPRYLETLSRAPGASDLRYSEGERTARTLLDAKGLPAASDVRSATGGTSPYRYLDVKGAPGASDLRYAEGGPARPVGSGVSPHRYLDVKGAPGASDLRYAEGGGASRPTGGGTSPHRYLDVKGIPGASDLRYAEGPGARDESARPRYLDVRSLPGASDLRYAEGPGARDESARPRYLDVRSLPGASDLRYLETSDRAPGASERRYLEAPPRAQGASEHRSLESPPGASDLRHLEAPARAAGASEHRALESPPRRQGAADVGPVDSSASAQGASVATPSPAEADVNHRYFEAPTTGRSSTASTSAVEQHRRATAGDVPSAPEPEENHRYFELPRTSSSQHGGARPPGGSGAAAQRPSLEAREGPSPQAPGEPLPRKPPSSDGRS
ncbi:DUF4912 domain-containing protein [Corallococcus macrosporus]|uniref:DUF4912 domain-containing protein n=1 Tax=Myxococcus fulvus (strain ATCC BAA-855 / HW-1) TaxID=483219 RepID=F8CK61_MYXFH|nr:DUF4912 domain-containing protein [Corallococcus macrosporus]AEI66437.1 hypothetical protein LILAB_22710 [Corallococcus macrosporus]